MIVMDESAWTGIATVIAVPVVLGALLRASARATVPPGVLGYSRALKVFGVVMGFLPTVLIGVVVVLKPPGPKELPEVIGVMLLFSSLMAALLIEVFRVRHSYDDNGVDYRSPWSKHRAMRWADVSEIRWRHGMKWLDLRTAGGVVIHLSPFLSGLDGFARIALARIPREVVGCSPAGRAALEPMIARQGRVLAMSQLTPERALEDLRAKGVIGLQ